MPPYAYVWYSPNAVYCTTAVVHLFGNGLYTETTVLNWSSKKSTKVNLRTTFEIYYCDHFCTEYLNSWENNTDLMLLTRSYLLMKQVILTGKFSTGFCNLCIDVYIVEHLLNLNVPFTFSAAAHWPRFMLASYTILII